MFGLNNASSFCVEDRFQQDKKGSGNSVWAG